MDVSSEVSGRDDAAGQADAPDEVLRLAELEEALEQIEEWGGGGNWN